MQPNWNTGDPLPIGVSATTGRPLNALSDEAIQAMLRRETEPSTQSLALQARADPGAVSFAVEGGIDANDLSQAGWGVLFAPDVDQKVKDALQPLLDHRRSVAEPFKIFDGPDGYRPGDSATAWLKRQGVRMDVVDPTQGVPFYLLLVGSAESLPFEFQYSLDIYWAVGRLWFDAPDQFRQYAESIVRYETAASVPTRRAATIFATEHDFDSATQSFMRQVARPLLGTQDTTPTVWKRQAFEVRAFLGEQAGKESLDGILRAQNDSSPAFLFTGTHGMEFDLDDPRQAGGQGALVCQDWDGYGKISKEHWFAASDVPVDARVHGTMYFCFACHAGGCPEFDNYDRLNAKPRRIARKAFFSHLPQTLLSHPQGGALAVLAHIERAWTYSFQRQGGGGQVQGFRDVIGRLLRGERIGQATDMFNLRWAAISVDLAEAHSELMHDRDVALKALGNMWVARDDARNYMVLGDPATRLRVEDMPKAG